MNRTLLPTLTWLVAAAAAVLASGCSSVPPSASTTVAPPSPWAIQSMVGDSAWLPFVLPGKRASTFTYVRKDGRDTIRASADSSASMLRTAVRIEPAAQGKVRFSWKVPALIAEADMALRDQDDSPVRIVLAFDGDRSRLSPRFQSMSEMARALTGEELPYATMMYVWCNKREPGSVIINPRTDRIRKLVVESGVRNLNQWLEYQRDVRADYVKVFGEDPGTLIGIGIMTDSDNTGSSTAAWYGPVRMVSSAAVR
jgi:hypothetical protein